MTSVGEILRAEREKQGRGAAEVAEELCITQRYLRAIEENNYQILPGIFFYKSFVRQYAAILKLDLKLIRPGLDAIKDGNESIDASATPKKPPVRPLDPLVVNTNRLYFAGNPLGWSVAALVGVLVLCSGFYSWWTRAPQAVSVAPAPVVVQPAPVAAPVNQVATPPEAESPTAPEASSPAGKAPEPPSLVSPAADTEKPTATVSLSTTTDAQNRVILHLSATEKTWLSITSNGKQIFAGVLEPSQSKVLTSDEQATMKVGNAGGLDVQLNGKPIGPLGPSGQVRTVLFTPDNFQILSASDADRL